MRGYLAALPSHMHIFLPAPRALSKQSVYAAPWIDQPVTSCVEVADTATPTTASAGNRVLGPRCLPKPHASQNPDVLFLRELARLHVHPLRGEGFNPFFRNYRGSAQSDNLFNIK
jgi:hypothetical protein